MAYLTRGKRALKASLDNQQICKKRCSPVAKAEYWCLAGLDQDGFIRQFIDEFIGYGVFAGKPFAKGEFLLEYRGRRLIKPSSKKNQFMFVFQHNEKCIWIDGSRKEGLCSYVNDAEEGSKENNSKMKKLVINNYPRLCLFATQDIKSGEEIRYDYGDDSSNLFWRHQAKDNNNSVGHPVDECRDDDPFDVEKERAGLQCPDFGQAVMDSKQAVSDSEGDISTTESYLFQVGHPVDECRDDDPFDVEKERAGLQCPDVGQAVMDSKQAVSDSEGDISTTESYLSSSDEYKPRDSELDESGSVVSDTESDLSASTAGTTATFGSKLALHSGDENLPRMSGFEKTNSVFVVSDRESDVSSINPSATLPCGRTLVPEGKSFGDDDTESLIIPVATASPALRKTVPQIQKSTCRVYDKRFFCLYCKKPQTKLKKHLTRMHKDEKDVIEMLNEKDKDKHSMKYIKIRNMGNHLQNVTTTTGEIVVCYRLRNNQHKRNAEDYGPCQYCYEWHVKDELWRHKRNCKFASGQKEKYRGSEKAASNLLLPRNENISEKLCEILDSMKTDQIGRVAKSDGLILKLGEKQVKRYAQDPDQHNYIRQNLRVAGRLLIALRTQSKNENAKLIDFMDSACFTTLTKAARSISLFDESTNRYGIPSLAIKVGQVFGKCLNIATRIGLETHNLDLVESCENMKKLMATEWDEEITINAHKTLQDSKRNSNKGLLPFTNDVKLLMNYLNTESEEQYKILQEDDDFEKKKSAWAILTELSLVHLIVFNRRRSGEVSKLTLDNYSNSSLAPVEPAVQKTLSGLELSLSKSMSRLELAGKRNRTVALLLPPTVKRNLDCLIENRERVMLVPNKYLFPRMSSSGHLRGTDCLRNYASLCGAVQPERLRSIKLRKQLATLSQIMNLKENEMDILAQFLGHDIRVHREYYRLPEATVQVAKVSKLLLMMEKGEIQEGKNLDEIETGDAVEDFELSDEGESDDDEVPAFNSSATVSDTEDAAAEPGVLNSCDIYDDDVPRVPHMGSIPSGPSKKRHCQKKRVIQKRPWTSEEKVAVQRHFAKHMLLGTLHGKREIENCLKDETALQNRNWTNVKDCIRNNLKKMNYC